jgi:hypothetical protein
VSAGLKLSLLDDRGRAGLISGTPTEAGLTLRADGSIAGTPMIPGTSTFAVTASSKGDDGWIRADSRQFTLTVSGQLTASLSRDEAEVGAPFRATLALSDGAAGSWSAVSVPSGIAVASDGTVSGTPTGAGAYAVTARFTTVGGAAADVSVRLTAHPRLAVVAKRLPTGRVGHRYAARLATRGGVGPVTWRLVRGHLPGGIRLVAGTGAVIGTARKTSSSPLTVQARDALGVVSTRTFVLRLRRLQSARGRQISAAAGGTS